MEVHTEVGRFEGWSGCSVHWSLGTEIRLEKVGIWVKWSGMEISKETYISHKVEPDWWVCCWVLEYFL